MQHSPATQSTTSPVPIIRSKSDGSGTLMNSSTPSSSGNLYYSSKSAKATGSGTGKKTKKQGFASTIVLHPIKFILVLFFLVIPLVQILSFSG